MHTFQQSQQKPNGPFIVSKGKPNIDVKDDELADAIGNAKAEMKVVYTQKKTKNLSNFVTLPTCSCQTINEFAQGGIPRSTDYLMLSHCRHAIISWHSFSRQWCVSPVLN